jgi:hypothetical protein
MFGDYQRKRFLVTAVDKKEIVFYTMKRFCYLNSNEGIVNTVPTAESSTFIDWSLLEARHHNVPKISLGQDVEAFFLTLPVYNVAAGN